MSVRGLIVCALVFLLGANGVSAARYQRCKDGKTLVWNSLRGVAQEADWAGARDLNGYATGEGTLTWYRLAGVVNTYTGKMVRGKFEGPVVKEQAGTRLQATFANGEKVGGWSEPREEKETAPSPSPKKRTAKVEEASEPEESGAETVSSTPKPARSPRPTVSPGATPRSTPSLTPSPIESPVPTATPAPKQTSTPTATPAPVRTPTPTPIATPSPIRTPTPTATPSPVRAPIATAIPATPRTTATSTPLHQPSAISAPSPPQLKPEPLGARSPGGLRLDQGLAPTRDSLDLALPPPRGKNVLPPAPWTEPQSLPSPSPKAEDRTAPSATAGPSIAMDALAGSKSEMIAEFKKQTADILAQAKKATNGFLEIQRIDAAQPLSPELSASISALAEQARDFRAKLGYEVAMYECGAETATSEALTALDKAMHDFSDKNMPAGRLKLMTFFRRFPAPSRDSQKPLWRYMGSIFLACEHARKDAESHLQRAKALESSGKKAEALREYQEIYNLYPNSITADKISTLQGQPH